MSCLPGPRLRLVAARAFRMEKKTHGSTGFVLRIARRPKDRTLKVRPFFGATKNTATRREPVRASCGRLGLQSCRRHPVLRVWPVPPGQKSPSAGEKVGCGLDGALSRGGILSRVTLSQGPVPEPVVAADPPCSG